MADAEIIIGKLSEIRESLARLDERVKNLEMRNMNGVRKRDNVWKIFAPALSTVITIVVIAILYLSVSWFPQLANQDKGLEHKIEIILKKLENN